MTIRENKLRPAISDYDYQIKIDGANYFKTAKNKMKTKEKNTTNYLEVLRGSFCLCTASSLVGANKILFENIDTPSSCLCPSSLK